MVRKLFLLLLIGGVSFGVYRWVTRPVPDSSALVEPSDSKSVRFMQAEPMHPPLHPPLHPPKAPIPYSGWPRTEEPQSEGSAERLVASLRAQLAADPRNAQIMAALGLVLAKDLQLPQEGIPHLEQSIKLDPGNGAVFYDLVGAYLAGGYGDRGETFLKSLLESTNSNPATIYAATADLLASTGRFEEAAEYSGRAVQAQSNAQTNSLHGNILLQNGDPRAEIYNRRAVEQNKAKKQELIRQGQQPTVEDERQSEEYNQTLAETLLQKNKSEEARKIIATLPDSEEKSHLQSQLPEGEGGSGE